LQILNGCSLEQATKLGAHPTQFHAGGARVLCHTADGLNEILKPQGTNKTQTLKIKNHFLAIQLFPAGSAKWRGRFKIEAPNQFHN
jgi:hypothetical protein